jgi:hypothetical protein
VSAVAGLRVAATVRGIALYRWGDVWGELQAASPVAEQATGASELLTRNELAALLRITPAQVSELVGRGLPCLRLGHRTLRYPRADALAWAEQQDRGGGGRESDASAGRGPPSAREAPATNITTDDIGPHDWGTPPRRRKRAANATVGDPG